MIVKINVLIPLFIRKAMLVLFHEPKRFTSEIPELHYNLQTVCSLRIKNKMKHTLITDFLKKRRKIHFQDILFYAYNKKK